MSRSAAGGAGGRRPAHGPVRLGTASLRAALVALLVGSVGLLAPSAQAAPAPPQPPVLAAPAPDDTSADRTSADDTSADRPVRIEVRRFDPRTVTPGSLVTVTGVLVNTGSSPVTDLTVRLQRGEVLVTRAELAAADEDPDPATTVVPGFQQIEGTIEPGGSLEFTYVVDSAELRLDRDGVYPVLLNVNGTVDGDTRRVGELSTFVVQQPLLPVSRTAVAWLWPLTERTHRTASGGFADDGLARSIATDGRLDRALAVVERLPSGTVPTPAVTLAIDPALVEGLQLLASGDVDVPGGDGSERADAEDFLERLRGVAAVHPVVALPYGDVDLDSLDAAGLGEVVTRSLPGTPAGTAQDPPGSPADPAAGTSVPPAGQSDAPPSDDAPAHDDGAGARILAEALDVDPRTDLAWAPGGALRPETLSRLLDGGVQQLVLSAGGVSTGDSAVGLDDATAAAATTVEAAGRSVEVLVADPRLTDVVGRSEHTPGGARLAEQRYLAELAVLTAQAPEATEQTVLVTAPRDVDAGPDGAGAMMAATTSLPWLRPAGLAELTTGPRTPAGELIGPIDEVRLDIAGLTTVSTVVAGRNDLAGAVAGDPGTALQEFDAAVARATSVAWHADPEGFRDAAGDLAGTLQRLRGQVTVLAPADGTYTLASSDAPLVLTVRNDLPFAVRVLLDVGVRGSRGLSVGDIGPQVLAPGQRATLQVPTSLRQSGTFAVNAGLTTPAGSPLGERVHMQVRSGAYGPISLIITIGAATLLALLFLRRLVNYLLRRRARQNGPQPVGHDTVGPPTRSPV
ncbi:DUF6049 family protein [Blastococcus sp. CCUG 61487]|uniref:DUF6049 family protein n=1 Tax=Blastococcus sp. CCUG 61487 TaxID=1840703 RepID=UPI00113D5A4C|nr:DUF6049 family protein [Blastococcus sp. CCUG 61487]TKJ26472.1 hypothetical protein A6V29_03800 [Blastococcus sp. CCUG 61487]